MTKLIHLIVELFRNIYRHPGTIFSSFLSLTLIFLLFDIFWISAMTSENFYNNLLKDLQMEIFVLEEYPDSLMANLESNVFKTEGVRQISYVSRADAKKELSRLIGTDLLAGYEDNNPLPRSFLIKFLPEYLNSKEINKIDRSLLKVEGVGAINFSRQWLVKAETTKAIIKKTGMGLGLLILLAALVSSANNIRFMARTRAVGFKQMRLLGAGELFITFPFLLEGILFGGISAIAGWSLLYYGKGEIQFKIVDIIFPEFQEIIIFCLSAAFLGFVSGYLGVRKKRR